MENEKQTKIIMGFYPAYRIPLIIGTALTLFVGGSSLVFHALGPKSEAAYQEKMEEGKLSEKCREKAAGLDNVLTDEESRKMAGALGFLITEGERADIGWRLWGNHPRLVIYRGERYSDGRSRPSKEIELTKSQMEKYLGE